jgi:AcrR family transcriptional regulator
MARSGATTTIGRRESTTSAETRRRLIDATIDALRHVGFAGASARDIAKRSGCNQGVIFYHFGTVGNLLLAALDDVSQQRMDRYRAALEDASDVASLMGVAQRILREDLELGYVTVLAEMIAGASVTPGLGAEITTRIDPWRDLTANAFERVLRTAGLPALVPAADVAHGVVAMYLGLEMLAHLDGDADRAMSLFDRLETVATLVATMTAGSTTGGARE